MSTQAFTQIPPVTPLTLVTPVTPAQPDLAAVIDGGHEVQFNLGNNTWVKCTTMGVFSHDKKGVSRTYAPTSVEDALDRCAFAIDKLTRFDPLEDYTEKGFTGQCPYCGDNDLDALEQDYIEWGIVQTMRCTTCKREWEESYIHTGLRLDDGKTCQVRTPVNGRFTMLDAK